MYKKIVDFISAEISEARNAPAKTSKIILAGEQTINIGDNFVIQMKQGTAYRYFTFKVKSFYYENNTTVIEGEDLIQQLFRVILPSIDTVSGSGSDIIKNLLNEANTRKFIDLYVNNANIDNLSKTYTDINVKNNVLGNIFQDIIKDSDCSMWVGYDEVNDRENAFFLKKNSNIKTLDIVAKEGANIIDEDLKQSSLDDIVNYIFLYYYPDKLPQDEHWTETYQKQRVLFADARVRLGDPGITDTQFNNVVVKCTALTHLTQDIHIGDTRIYVESTSGFDTGRIVLNSGVFEYSSKGQDYFDLVSGFSINVSKTNSVLYPYVFANYDDIEDHEAQTKAQFYALFAYFPKGTIKHIEIPCYGMSAGTEVYVSLQPQGWQGTAGSLDFIYQKKVSGEGNISFDCSLDIEEGFYAIYVQPAKAGEGYVFWPAMGACGSKTGQAGDSEITFWIHVGSPMKKGWGIGDYVISQSYPLIDHTLPDKQPSIKVVEDLYGIAQDLWSGGYSGNQYIEFSDMGLTTLSQEGSDCLKFTDAGTYTLDFYTKENIQVSLAIYTQIFLRYQGKANEIRIMQDDSNYYKYSLGEQTAWVDKTIKISQMTKVGNPTIAKKIQFITTGFTFLDSLYFLGNSDGTLLEVKDDVSMQKYGQHPHTFFAKGVSDSSIAISLANVILNEKAYPSWNGTITMLDVPSLDVFSRLKVIIPTKNINNYLEIKAITHFSDGTAKITVGNKETDLGVMLAQINKDIETLKLNISDTGENQTYGSLPYTNHAGKHEKGGLDELNVAGLDGILNQEQKTNWSLIADKPSSSTSDIDDAVTKKHTHSNKAQLDLVTDGDHDVRTDNPHGTSDTNLIINDVTTNDVSTSKHGFTPKAPNDNAKFLRGDGTWSKITTDDALDDTMANKLLIPGKRPFMFFYTSYDNVESAVYGSGSIIQQLWYAVVISGTTANSWARQNLNQISPTSIFSPSGVLIYSLYPNGMSGNTLGFMGLYNGKLAGETSRAQNTHHVGIWYDNGSWYFSTANGTNRQETDITSYITTSVHNEIKITRESDGNIRLYVNGTLRATHSTYIGYYGYFQLYVHNKSTTASQVLYSYFVIRKG